MPRPETSLECAYCGEAADTDDHVPAQALLAGVPKRERPSVRSCASCNQGASDDDEYFRDVVVKYHAVGDRDEAQPILESVQRALSHPMKKGYAIATLRSWGESRVMTRSGLDLGVQPVYSIDVARVARVVTRYVRGLHRRETGVRITADQVSAVINVEWIKETQRELAGMLAGGTVRMVKPGVFWYKWAIPYDAPGASLWLLTFFDAFPVVGIVRALEASKDPESGITEGCS
jgi:hypothetical protein